MPEYQEKSKIIATETIAPGIVRLTVHAPLIIGAASPGQFVMVRVSNQMDPLLRRPFSIHTTSAHGNLQLLFKETGRGTCLLSAMETGQTVDLIGPLGRGFFLERDRRICLVGGGMGIAPLHFLARRILQTDKTIDKHHVLLGARKSEELSLLMDDFQEMGYPVQAATDDGSLGHHGLVPELLPALLPDLDLVYACGPWPMMRAVAGHCAEAGVACQVSLETHMACGIGACLGCTLHGTGERYIHVCKDGPVFNSEEVQWDTQK